MPSDASVPESAGRHLHPATLLFTLGSAAWRLVVPAVAVLFFARGGREEIWLTILFAPAAIAAVLRYATFRYAFGAEDLIVRHGLVFRNERHVPYARIQSVDLVQNPLQRLLGVAEVRVQTASGNEAEATFRVLSLEAVEAMRRHVASLRGTGAVTLSGAAPFSVGAAGGEIPAPADVRRLAAMSPKEIVLYGLISNRGMVVVGAALGAWWQLSIWRGEDGAFPFDPRAIGESVASLSSRPGGMALAVLAVAGIILALRVLSIGYAFVAFHGFTLEGSGGNLRTATGLLTRLTATIPRHRIQILTLRETLLHRLFGRVSVRVATAGGHGGETERTQREDWLVPLLPRGDLAALVREIFPDVDPDTLAWRPVHRSAFRRLAVRRLAAAAVLLGVPLAKLGPPGAGIAAALAAGIVLTAWLRARSLAWSLGDDVVAFRSGFADRATGLVRFSKIQVVASLQSPFDRRHRTAIVAADTAGATGAHLRIRIPFVPEADARSLVATLEDGAARTAFRW